MGLGNWSWHLLAHLSWEGKRDQSETNSHFSHTVHGFSSVLFQPQESIFWRQLFRDFLEQRRKQFSYLSTLLGWWRDLWSSFCWALIHFFFHTKRIFFWGIRLHYILWTVYVSVLSAVVISAFSWKRLSGWSVIKRYTPVSKSKQNNNKILKEIQKLWKKTGKSKANRDLIWKIYTQHEKLIFILNIC